MLLEKLDCEELTDLGEQVLDTARRVYRRMGPEHARTAYLDAVCEELGQREISFEREVWQAERLHGSPLNVGDVVDVLAGGRIVLLIDAASETDLHDEMRLLTLLGTSGHHLGYVLNFGARSFDQGVRQLYYDAKPVCQEA